ncbi:hypothetical protein THAOC_21867 [Thalassiosira oceanica]|uniref:HMG box domain-containing protein n=1 Tax=Thalassiosira oceanica TaxID=159749 RepID=K0SAP7_THAOC|nr:hypothetical protein THAOC_21867 [Thalassiosira oceanica]|eukprot:EJK58036.1 hypothetical protein THAOC_21867 [Thalassiosira oceanica]
MSASSPSNQTQTTKPKRPLSGYNLFYRYKRNSILTHISATDDDSAASIQRVITTLPGLEQTPPQIAASLSAEQIKEVRSLAIRNAMEGKIFPNENARNRLHRKVHGIGFVEMGKVMRETWSELDVFSKGVFDELAEIGRVRYRGLVAEYKRNESLGLAEPRDKPKKKRKRTRKTTTQSDCTVSSLVSHSITSIHSLNASPLVDLEPLSVTSITSRPSVSDAAMPVSHDRFRRDSNYSMDGNQLTPGSAGSNITAARNAFLSMVNKTVPPPPLFRATIQHQPHTADQMPTSPSADDYAELTRWLADESATNSIVASISYSRSHFRFHSLPDK